MPFSVLVFCLIREGANVCDTFNIFIAKPATWHFTGLVNTTLHYVSSNSLLLCSAKEISSLPFQLPFLNHSHLLLSLSHSSSLRNCPCSAFCFHSFNCFFFLFFLAHIDNVLSQVGLAAAVLTRASLLCVAYFARLYSPPQHSPQHLPDLFLHLFLVCRVCLHMISGGVSHIW